MLGWDEVAQALERAASHYRDGEATGFESVAKYVTAELAYTVEIERCQAKVEGRDDVTPIAVRVTTIFRPEEGTWKVVSRHADPITSPGPAESVYRSRATARGLLGQIGLLITPFQGRAV